MCARPLVIASTSSSGSELSQTFARRLLAMETKGSSPHFYLLFVVLLCTGYICEATPTYCAYAKKSVVKFSILDKSLDEDGEGNTFVTFVHGDSDIFELLDSNQTARCPSSYKYCYALWQEDYVNKNLTVILAQGCWESGTGFDCSSDGECVSNKRPPKALNNTKFCCCIGDRCNQNVSDGYISYEDTEPTPRFVEQASYDTQTVIIAVVTMCSVSIVIMFVVCFTYHMCSSNQKPSPDSVCLMEAPPPSSPLFNIESLKMREAIGRGRYGCVYKGTLYNQTVAVKVFAAQSRQYYMNERYIYCLPFMDHPYLPKLIGADEQIGIDDRPTYRLVLSYAPKGCLQDFLGSTTLDWPTFCKMAQTITKGLAYLHTEVRKEGKLKMCIAHRDLTSRNILVKADNTCMLCDFGFAICISGSKYYLGGEEQVAEATSLADVGTLRYMAPEGLEGAVNLRDCESSLKQIDVYSLGLVLWEIATRCVELFQGVEVPEYKLPFVAEIGPHPSMEQMQVLVARHKARPLFPDIWKDTNPAVRSLKETIEDCWDQDAEARLTALCVEERLSELPMLWDRHKAGVTIQGVSPTVNPTSVQQRVLTVSPIIQSFAKGPHFEFPAVRNTTEMSSPNGILGNRYSADCSISENTAETSITVSPNELTPNSCGSYSSSSGSNMKNLSANNNNNIIPSNLRVTVPLQPYQGKNPIMERNLIMDPIEELAVSGNSLIDKKDKYSSNGPNSIGPQQENGLFNTLLPNDTSESNALVSNDELSQPSRACNPIPYVQNAVHVMSTVPKQPNVPGNGHVLHGDSPGDKKKKSDEHKLMSGLRNFFKFPRLSAPPEPIRSAENLTAPSAVPIVHVPKFLNSSEGHLPEYRTKPKVGLDTEVYINGQEDDFGMTQTIVRPVANKQVYSQTVPCENEIEDINNLTNYPIANGVVQSQTHPLLNSESNAVGNNSFFKENSHEIKRPNTLPVAKFGSRRVPDFNPNLHSDLQPQKSSEMSHSQDDISHLEDTTDEMKTPTHAKDIRNSLYNDRMMSAESEKNLSAAVASSETVSPQSSASVPQSINSLCESEFSNFFKTCQEHKSKQLPIVDHK